MKFLGKILIFIVAVFVVVVLARNVIVKAAVELGAKAAVGLPVNIKMLDIGLQQTYLDIEGLNVGNPEGFGNETMVDMPKVFVDYHLSDIMSGKLHLEKVEFDLRQFTVVRNRDGKLNINSIKGIEQDKTSSGKPETPKKETKAMPIQLDHVHLKIGKVVFIDRSGAQESVREFNINLDESYENITEQGALIRVIVLRVMTKTPLAMLTNFDLGSLQSSVGGIVGSATDLASQTAAKGLDTIKTTTSMAGSLAGDAKDTVKDAAGTVKSIAGKLKNPFGSGN
ncbi:MAG: hypothetical protein BWY44_00787 [Candidatus Omnitrophica bacterium ADurb.Bin292]|nr:MAG: hypothetical protein BWY44_00787 [Candidatus Omnitrophica bacterium ADurb.Bin292]HPW77511.1 hypothetical protein [Candidatus Omnitrophota bacterium]HQB11361.1 hypothetical protein [Candidatus Omnitrophota bacterium]